MSINRKYIIIAFLLYVLFIIFLVSFPFSTTRDFKNIAVINLRGDYIIHVLMFGPWVVFNTVFRLSTIFWVALGITFAAGTEFVQHFMSYRTFNVNDLIANLAGILIGSCGLYFTNVKNNK